MKKHFDYYYLSNREMIEVVFSSRVSLLTFYFRESFKRTIFFTRIRQQYGSLNEEKVKASSAKAINLGM